MLCNNCRSKTATYHKTTLINGVKDEVHLCAECAQRLGEFASPSAEIFKSLNVGEFFGGFLQQENTAPKKPVLKKCESCGTKLTDFYKTAMVGCHDCYGIFANEIIKMRDAVHGANVVHRGKDNSGNFNITPHKLTESELQLQERFASVVVTSRIRFARNFWGLPSPFMLTDERAFSKVMKNVFDAVKPLGNFEIFTMQSLPVESRNVMFEKHLISKQLLENPNFSGVILSDDEKISIMLNEEDQVREQCILPGFRLREAFEKLNEIDNVILKIKPMTDNASKHGSVGFDSKLGFLTVCPTNLGTAMRASVMLFLPAISMLGKAAEVQKVVQALGLTVRGVMGEGSRADGYMFQISNQYSLGDSEEDIIKRVENTVARICEIELAAREQLLKQNKIEISDLCLRAFGTLSSSFVMSADEFNELIGKVKLGQCLGILKFKNEDLPQSLSKIVQPYTLMQICKKKLNAADRDIFRAEYLRKTLQDSIILQ